ncbi:Bro-N domain-containing protein [Patescibacteria group bacterium]|nr:Bro-N domain-containing protein [Patescibacteria group bacterium]MBU1885075.1 Bro-N domain-containing protein [Patescibacteria group bacterium]
MKNKQLLEQPHDPLVFQQKQIRRIWYKNSWWFSILDIIITLTESPTPKTYWAKMKSRDLQLDQQFPFWEQLKLKAQDGKMRNTDCADIEGIFRIIQSIPSKKAEPFKRWLAKVGRERLDEIQDPELAMKRMKSIYQKKGYPKNWIEKRVRGIAVRNELTDEWKTRGANEGRDYAILTNEIMQGTFDLSVKQYKKFKGLDKENLRDHMVDIELILTMLAETTTTKLHRDRESHGLNKLKKDAKESGAVAGRTRKDIESRSNKPVRSKNNYLPKKLK